MKQAVNDLKNLYGKETIDSDEGRVGEADSDSEGIDELAKQSAFLGGADEQREYSKDDSEGRFNAYVPTSKKTAQPQQKRSNKHAQPQQQPDNKKYDPRDFLDDAAR